ncbi:MAG: SIMPL domain-containing protein [Verrucomicrobia bacterium]|nr:SIMPL domain-containing protein [Verrucomicrobiota bacterium]
MSHHTGFMITTRSFAVLGVLLSVGLAVFGVQVGLAVKKGREFDRYLTVRGLSEREVKSTLAIWPIRFAVYADDLPQLKQSIEKTKGVVQVFLTEQGITAESVSYGLPVVSDKDEERSREDQNPLPRYKAVITLVVRSAKVDVVKQAIQHADSLLEKGITLVSNEYGDHTQFLFDGVNAVKPDMIKEATANARIAAEKFAQDSKAKVGSIRRAYQGVLEIDDRDVATPEIKVLRVVTTVDFFFE